MEGTEKKTFFTHKLNMSIDSGSLLVRIVHNQFCLLIIYGMLWTTRLFVPLYQDQLLAFALE